MKTNAKFFAFLTPVLLLPLLYFAVVHVFKYNIVGLIYPQEEYLTLLKENRLDGCKLLKYQQGDVLFIGGSDSYSDWDFLQLQKHFSPLRISACIMAGMHNETVMALLDVLKNQGHKYKLIILSINQDMFWKQDEDGLVATRENIRYLQEMNDSLIRDIVTNLKEKQNIEPFLPYPGFEEDVMRFDSSWLDYLARKYPMKRDRSFDYAERVPAICHELSGLAEHILINHLPVNTHFDDKYTSKARGLYQKIIASFEKCGLKIFLPTGFDNSETRYYANRRALPEVSKALLEKDEQKFTLKQFFDLEHFNYVGAEKFTRWWLTQHQHDLRAMGIINVPLPETQADKELPESR